MSRYINGTFSGALPRFIFPRIYVTWNQSRTDNTSTVTATLQFRRLTTNYYSYNLNGHSTTLNIGGDSATASRTFDVRVDSPPNTVNVWTRTTTIQHNSSGNASVTISANGNTGVNLGSYNFSETITLPQIDRETTITSASMSNISVGTARDVNFGLDVKNSSYKLDIQVRYGNTTIFSDTGLS